MRTMVWVGLSVLLWIGGVCANSANGSDARVLYILCPQEYFAPESVARFEERYGCRVDLEYVDCHDVIFEMLRNGEAGYDLVVCTSGLAEALARRKRLALLHHEQLPNIAGIASRVLALFPDPGMTYQIPYTISVIGLAYDKNAVPPEDRGSWRIYEKMRYAKKGAMLSEMRYTFGAALSYLGEDVNTVDPDLIERAEEVLHTWKSGIALFSFSRGLDELSAGKLAFAQTYSGAVARRMADNPNLVFSVPREGSIIKADCFTIPVDAEQQKLAHSFINHMLEPVNAAANMDYGYCYLPLPEARKLVKNTVLNNPAFKIPLATAMRCQSVRYTVESAYRLYDKAWEDVLLAETDDHGE